MTNIEAVLAEANRPASRPRFDLSSLYYMVCARHPADLAQIRAEPAHCVGAALRAVYPQADVRRQDPLLEIGAIAAHPLVFMSGRRDQ